MCAVKPSVALFIWIYLDIFQFCCLYGTELLIIFKVISLALGKYIGTIVWLLQRRWNKLKCVDKVGLNQTSTERNTVHTASEMLSILDSKVHGANMGPIWGRQEPGEPHVGPMNFAIWGILRYIVIGRDDTRHPETLLTTKTSSCITCSSHSTDLTLQGSQINAMTPFLRESAADSCHNRPVMRITFASHDNIMILCLCLASSLGPVTHCTCKQLV